jgi:hypothetical protein
MDASHYINRRKSGIRSFIPFTIRGIFIFVLAAGLFILGVARADLASLFWGCGFLSLALYSLIGNLIFVRMMRSYLAHHPGSINAFITRDGVFPGEPVAGELSAILPSFFIPGFGLHIRMNLAFHNRKSLVIARALSPGTFKTGFTVVPAHRGVYRCEHAFVVIEDLLGFTESTIGYPIEEYIKVFPAPLEKDAFLFKISSDDSTDTLKRKRVSDELLEVKKYYPGDDIRRLNWKVFAHTRELFVRKGEETPPPDVKLLFILDPALSPMIPESVREDYLDSLVEACATLLLLTIDGGNPVMLCVPGLGGPRTFEKKGKSDLLTLLAGIFWQEEAGRIELPHKRNLHGVVITAPGSPALPGIIAAVRERNWGLSMLMKNFIFPGNSKHTFNVRKLLTIKEKSDVYGNLSPWEVINFKQSLYSEIAKYRQDPWRLQDVKEI